MKGSSGVETFLAFLRDCEQQVRMSEAAEKEANDLTQDILHCLELEPHRYHEYAALAKELRTVRQDRRKAKDTLAVAGLVLVWMEENRGVIKSLERLLGDLRKTERRMEDRAYTPRVRGG